MKDTFGTWVIFTLFPILISGATFYISLKRSAIEQENRLTKIEAKAEHHEEELRSQSDRITRHEESQKTLISMVEQIKHLTENMGELRTDIREIMEKLR